ncbi:MAG: hypothetical protein VX152_04800, partial [Pseudomonadota bacterium]|nr:hypothetical protein [Pseudomonadota bacterium]
MVARVPVCVGCCGWACLPASQFPSSDKAPALRRFTVFLQRTSERRGDSGLRARADGTGERDAGISGTISLRHV